MNESIKHTHLQALNGFLQLLSFEGSLISGAKSLIKHDERSNDAAAPCNNYYAIAKCLWHTLWKVNETAVVKESPADDEGSNAKIGKIASNSGER